MTYTHSTRERERVRARKYECLFMCAVNDPNYDERTNNNAYKTHHQEQQQQQLDLLWQKVYTRKSRDVWRKVLTIIFVHSVCQQQQQQWQQQQLRCILIIYIHYSVVWRIFVFISLFFHVEWSSTYVCMHVKKALEIYTLQLVCFPLIRWQFGRIFNESHHYSTFLRNFLRLSFVSLEISP